MRTSDAVEDLLGVSECPGKRTARHRVVAFMAPGTCMFQPSVAGEVSASDPQLGVDWYRFSVAVEHPGPTALEYGLSLDVVLYGDIRNGRGGESVGTTPHQWLIRQRVLHAQELLEQGHLSIEEVALRCRFRSGAAMRPHFARMVTTSPADCHRCFATC